MELEAIVNEAKSLIEAAADVATLDAVRVDFMGKKGKLTDLLKGLGKLSNEERPLAGQKINVAKQEIQLGKEDVISADFKAVFYGVNHCRFKLVVAEKTRTRRVHYRLADS